MENVYIQRNKTNGYCVFSENYSDGIMCNSVLIICYLYYEETLNDYYKYLDAIPCEIKLILVTSNKNVFSKLEYKYLGADNVEIRFKSNRGRDLSALLVSCQDELLNYRYMCFVHDKKTLRDYEGEELEIWIENMWSSMMASEEYIRNMYSYMEQNNNVGLLVPLVPFGDNFQAWLGRGWGKNYLNTMKLADSLELNVDIDIKYPPIALGSVFWCRSKALKKLFEKKWKYADFPQEPMPLDGTISHAIERVLPFVAQDAGFETKTVMSSGFAPKYLSFVQDGLKRISDVLYENMEFKTLNEINCLDNKKKKIEELLTHFSPIYLYGSGHSGIGCARMLRTWGIEPKAFLTSQEPDNCNVEGIKVYKFSSVKDKIGEALIIITPFDPQIRSDINQMLENQGFTTILWHEK